jgi:hypothetical protein
MMLGFMLLAGASIGYLRDAAKIKRVVGSVIICSLLLLVFFAFVIASVGSANFSGERVNIGPFRLLPSPGTPGEG